MPQNPAYKTLTEWWVNLVTAEPDLGCKQDTAANPRYAGAGTRAILAKLSRQGAP